MKKICLMVVVLLMSHTAYTQNLAPGTFFLGADLKLEGIAARLNGKWKDWEYKETLNKKKNLEETVTLYFGVMPFKDFTWKMDTLYVGDYAQRYHMPVTLEHSMMQTNQHFKVIRIETKYETRKLLLGYFYGVGHGSWYNDGDLFDFFPEQYLAEKYLRIGGYPSPQWFEAGYGMDTYRFTAVFAPELTWGAPPSILFRYNQKESTRQWAVFYKEEAIDWGNFTDKDTWEENKNYWGTFRKKYWLWEHTEHFKHYAISLRTPFIKYLSVYSGLVYRPNRVGWAYTYVEETGSDKGYLGSKYIIKEDKTKETDGLGGKINLSTEHTPFFNKVTLKGTYLGILAGNSREAGLDLVKKVKRNIRCDLELLYRNPVIGPLPYLYEGSRENPAAVVTLPRGEESPFWANIYNRKAYQISFIFLYDPSRPYFYRLPERENELGLWNLNELEQGPAFAVRYDLRYYPTGTDLYTFVARDEGSGEVKLMWDSGSYGLWAAKRPLQALSFMGVITFKPDVRVSLFASIEESFARTGWAYMDQAKSKPWPQTSLKPFTNPVRVSAEIQKHVFILGGTYGKDVFGPEEWDEQFGYVIDNYYNAYLQLILPHSLIVKSYVRFEYFGYRETDDKYIFYPSLDEFRLSYTLKTGRFIFDY